MKTFRAKLAQYIELDGWDRVRVDTQDLEWWADEAWQLRSRWAPQGAEAFLTFLVDPQWEGDRKRGQGVWAVAAFIQAPRSREELGRGLSCESLLRKNRSRSS